MYKIKLNGRSGRLYVDDILKITLLKGLLSKKEETVHEISIDNVEGISKANKTLVMTYREDGKKLDLTLKFHNAEEALNVEDLIKKHLEKKEAIKKKIDEMVNLTKNIGLTYNAAFNLVLNIDKKCNWQKADEEFQRLFQRVEELSSKGLNLNEKMIEEIEKEVKERKPERVKELILDFVKNLYSAVNNVKDVEPSIEITSIQLKQFTEFLLLVAALGLVIRRGIMERADKLKETVIIKLSELEPSVDKKYFDKIKKNIESAKYEEITKISATLASGIKAVSETSS